MLRIVFVCTGNLCRSPMAEAILRKRWKERGRDDLIVSSMGIHGLERQSPPENAQIVCERNGVDITRHLSRAIVYEELAQAHLILVMERIQKEFIEVFFPRFCDKSFLLACWPNKPKRRSDIADPIGSGIKAYQKAFDVIAYHVDRIVPVLIKLYA